MTPENIIAILVALIPTYFGWKQFNKNFTIDRRKATMEENVSVSKEWQNLYINAKKETEEMSLQLKELKDDFHEMKTDNQLLRIEFNSFKRTLQDEKKRLNEKIGEHVQTIKCLNEENASLKSYILTLEYKVSEIE